MFRKHICALTLLLFFAAVAPAQADKTDDFIKAEMQRQNIPGLSLAVVKDGQVIKAEGYGLANMKLKVPARPETVYRIASVSKQFIATGIMLLVQNGQLSLDDSVTKYLEGAPERWKGIKIWHLLAHTSGLVREPPGFNSRKVQSDMDVIKSAYHLPLLFEPGAKHLYSNLGYFALAETIRKISGRSWTEYLSENVFKPSGMNTTYPTNTKENVLNRAAAYVDNSKLQEINDDWPALRPSGAFLSTVLDMARWDAMLYTDKVLSSSSRELMWTPAKLNDGTTYPYGFGWELGSFKGQRIVYHGGGGPGIRTKFARFVDYRLTIIVLINLDDVDVDSIVNGIANVYLPASTTPRTRGIFFAHHTPAQSTAKTKAKSDATSEAERIAKERRTQARSLLISLASDARSFRDQTLRARSLARIADALWTIDSEQGRTHFRNAWEAAEKADQESQKRFSHGPNLVTLSEVRSIMSQVQLDLRREVLKLVVRRDRVLAEEFLQKLQADHQETKAENSTGNLWALNGASQQRLNLAKELLNTGDVERALQFADPVLGSVTISTLDFVTQLRDKDPAAADRRYEAMLANTRSNVQADANTISILSSYLFTPHTYVIFNVEGGASTSGMPSRPPANVSPQLRLAFFQTASHVLLQPQPPPEQDQRSAGIVGTYMVLKRMMPLFEQYAPQEITVAIRGQFQALTSLVSEAARQREDEWVPKNIGTEEEPADQEQSLPDQIERAKNSDERDELHLKLALLALRKDDIRARDYVSKIDESEFRKQAQEWVDPCLAISAINKKKIEVALELARIGELTHIQRVWLLTQAAKLLAKTDRGKALSLLDQASAEARRIENSDLDRPRGLLAIANALKLIDPSRAWEASFDAVKAANSTDGFTGEDGVLALKIDVRSHISFRKDPVPDFDLEGIFGMLANDDYDRAVQLARGFQGEAPRANATIAIARSVLNEKATPVITPAKN